MINTISITKGTNIKKEFECHVLLGVLERANGPEWQATSFVQPKPKTNWVHF